MIINIDTYAVQIDVHKRCFRIRKGEERRRISPFRVTAIHIRKSASISTPAILLAAEFEIPLLFFDNAGKVKARLWRPQFGSIATIRIRQIRFSESIEGLRWAIDRIVEKLEGQGRVLKWLANRIPSHADQLRQARTKLKAHRKSLAAIGDEEAKDAPEPEAIRTLEGQAGKVYWTAFFAALERYEAADKRTRRPATDPLNALINYGYGMLYGEVEAATITAGLDHQVGILHAEEHGRPAFVLDAIESFRPWTDRLVAELAIRGKITADWFKVDGEKYWLRREGKREFITAVIEMLKSATQVEGKRIKRKDQIQRQQTVLAGYLLEGFDPKIPSQP